MISLLVLIALLFQVLPSVSGDEYLVQNYTVEDGLPVNSVNGIVQDDNGYLWFSTLDGLVRYDGYQFRIYDSGNTEGMITNRIGGIMKTDSNEIWMIHPDGTITRKTGSKFKGYSEVQGDFEGQAERFVEAKNGDVWISTTEGIFRFDPETDSFYTTDEPLLQSNTHAIESTIGGGVLALNENGLVLWEGNETSVLIRKEEFPILPENVLHVKQFTVNDVWVMGGGGLFKYSLYSKEIDFVFQTDDPQSTVWNLHHDIDGMYIINTSEGFYTWEPVTQYVAKLPIEISTTLDRINLVFKGAHNEKILLGDDEVLINRQLVFETEDIQSGFIDREGSLWISTLREGIFQIRQSDFFNITAEDIQGFENIYPVIQSANGVIWAGSFVNGIYRIADGRADNWNRSNSNLTGNLCRFLFEDDDGTIYASMWGEGLWRYAGNDWEKIDQVDQLTNPNVTIEAMYRTQDNRLFIGTTDQLVISQDGDFKRFADSSASEFRGVRVIRESRDGTLFLGTNGNGLTILKNGIQRKYTTRNSDLTSDFIRDIHVQSKDTLWLATENLGLNRIILDEDANLTSVSSITEQDGLIQNSLHRIIETPGRQLWISSNGGIMRVSKEDLNRYADGTSENLSALFFDEKDGMVSREANGGVQTAGMLSVDQKLWFPNQKGITIIDPASITSENSLPAPQPIIEEVVLPDTTLLVEEHSEVQVPNLQRNMRVKFSAPNFFASGRIQFRYKLVGVNENWEDGGQNLEAVFTNLPPGTHELLVQTHRAGNRSAVSEASLLIMVPNAFYETNWFYLTIALFGVLVIFGGIKYRTRVLEEREKKLQERVDLQTQELKEVADQKSRFFSGITHELKTPLSLISGPLGELLEKPNEISSELALNRLHMMNRNNKRLQNLVDQILDVTRLNAEAMLLTLKPVKITEYTRQIVGQFHSKLEREEIELLFESDDIEDLIYVDPAAWERIIINLMSNAIRFSPKDSTIQISIRDLSNKVSINIKDEGMGIDESEHEKVFEYLYQGKGTDPAEGTGIGLYLVKGLVEHMGGSIHLNSKNEEGADFVITLQKGFEHFRNDNTVLHEPFALDQTEFQESSTETNTAEQQDKKTGSPHVLIVEDNDDFREYLYSILSDKYQVSAASEGEEALDFLEDTVPDLIISDVMMPGMNGLEFVNSLRKREKFQHLPVLFLSARDQETDMETGLSTGADLYLTKPIKTSLLLSQIVAVLRRERILKSNKIEPIINENDEEPFVREVRTIVYRQLGNPSLNINMLADTLFMSRRKLYTEWGKYSETSLNDFIKQVRLHEAKVLLSENEFNVQETAQAVGYSDPNYFSTSFKKEFGMSPSEVMK